MSQLFVSGGQSIGVSASASVPPMNTQDWSPLGWTDWISLHSKASLVLHCLLEFAQTHVSKLVTLSNHLILFRPLLLMPSIFPSIRVFPNESALRIRWSRYWSFSFSISPSNEHPGLISSRMDWLDLLAVQGTLKSLLQHHSSKASILRPSAFFTSPTLTSIHDHWKNHSLD